MIKTLLLGFMLCVAARAQFSLPLIGVGYSNAAASITFINSVGSQTPPTSSTNMTGANFCAVELSCQNTTMSGVTVSDSLGNTYGHLTTYHDAFNTTQSTIYYYAGLTGGASMTFSVSGATEPAIAVECFSGLSASPFQTGTDSGATVQASTLATGSISAPANSLVVTGASTEQPLFAAVPTIDSPAGFTVTNSGDGSGSGSGYGMGYKIYNSSASVNVTWDQHGVSGSEQISVSIAAFK